MSESLAIPHQSRHADSLPALFDPAGRERSAVLLAHGAGGSMESPFLSDLAAGLAGRGLPVLRFNYPYRARAEREGRRLPPDRRPVLEEAHEAALDALEARLPGRRVLLCGKSMGGRMGTYPVARGRSVAGLVLVGYPLHPAGKPEKLRDEQFRALCVPALFLQGDRDELCELELLRRSLEGYGGEARLRVFEGCNHSFVPKRGSGRNRHQVLEEVLEAIDAWEAERFG